MQSSLKTQEAGYRSSGKLPGKVALITGADIGIGRAVAVACAKEGAFVAIVYLDSHKDAQKVKQEVEQQGRRPVTIAGDVGDERFCQQGVQQTLDTLGQLDILVNAYKGNVQLMDYAATKGAIVSFTPSLSQALMEQGIRGNAFAPDPVWTPLIPSTMPAEHVEQFSSSVPMKRAAQPDEIASCYVFLASSDSSFMSGQRLHPNEGTIVGS
jgi:NAD(P)-dependent dehydrogenase (short-subunit alcohol dehydrogenase family)